MDPVSPHLARLGARSRPAGSAAADDARAYCADTLRGFGFVIREQEFKYSKFPGAWLTPVVGAALPVAATVLFAARERSPASWVPIAIGLLLAAAGLVYLSGPGVLDFPLLRRRGVNLEAVRGGDEPRVWLVAHIDSKWQPVSMILRVLGVCVAAVGVAGLLLSALLEPQLGPVFLVAVRVGAVPLILSFVGDRNHGTLDNASGVATVLEAAGMLGPRAAVGVLITDAEELALAGARAWATARKPVVALNCDSVDDDGDLVVMYGRSAPREIISRLQRAAAEQGERVRAFRLIPGILTDSVALDAAGWATVTLSRGTIRTLGRIHTSHDTLHSMDGRGIAGAARVLAQTATELG